MEFQVLFCSDVQKAIRFIQPNLTCTELSYFDNFSIKLSARVFILTFLLCGLGSYIKHFVLKQLTLHIFDHQLLFIFRT